MGRMPISSPMDLPYMAELLGTPGEYDSIKTELQGVIFKDPMAPDLSLIHI